MSDDAILDMIFQPGLDGVPLTALEPEADSALAAAAVSHLSPSLLSRLRALETSAVRAAEARQFDDALRQLDECISECDTYASAYNNRAQVRQLSCAASGLTGDERVAHLRLAMADADRAVVLANGDRSVLRQAHTQRGMIHAALGEEESALAEYRLGASFGNTFARGEAVRLNPYAKLCNQYLQQALQSQWSGLAPQADAAHVATGTAESGQCAGGAACKKSDATH